MAVSQMCVSSINKDIILSYLMWLSPNSFYHGAEYLFFFLFQVDVFTPDMLSRKESVSWSMKAHFVLRNLQGMTHISLNFVITRWHIGKLNMHFIYCSYFFLYYRVLPWLQMQCMVIEPVVSLKKVLYSLRPNPLDHWPSRVILPSVEWKIP